MKPNGKPNGSSGQTLVSFLWRWSLAYGVALSGLRVVVLLAWGEGAVSWSDLPPLGIGLLGQVAAGSLLGIAMFFARGLTLRIVMTIFLGAWLGLHAAAFHYEAFFGRLPSAALLRYLGESQHLSSSLAAQSPIWAVVLEAGIILGLLAVLGWRLLPRLRADRTVVAGLIALAACWLTTGWTHLFPAALPGEWFWKSRLIPVWFAQSAWLGTSAESEGQVVAEGDVWLYQRRLGQNQPFGGIDPGFPLCREHTDRVSGTGNGRSVLFVILESVGKREMNDRDAGRAVMPNLRRIASENLSFTDVMAVGEKSSQALPALFAGIPAQPATNLLWRTPLNAVEGLPLALARRGYRTAYFHGSDLSFEQQRAFIRMVGFDEIYEKEPGDSTPVYAWGYSDREMFARLQTWVDTHRTERANQPFFASLFTLSSHHPYVVPPDFQPVFSKRSPSSRFKDDWESARGEGGPRSALRDALFYLDQELDAFYRWYLEREKPRGTLLVLVGDHTPHLAGGSRPSFQVPLILAGLEAPRPNVGKRLAGQFDIPATLRSALDIEPGRCDQGLDLLAEESSWPAERWLPVVSGDSLEHLFIWSREAVVELNRISERYTVFGRDRRLTADEERDIYRTAREFADICIRLSFHLTTRDAFAPVPPTVSSPDRPLPPVSRPLVASHRGQTSGPLPPAEQNRPAAIQAAIEAGFEWVEIDLQITRDGQPVLMHDGAITDAAGQQRRLCDHTLKELRQTKNGRDLSTLKEVLDRFGDQVGFLLELKPQGIPSRDLALVREVARLLGERQDLKGAIIDSFSQFLAPSMKRAGKFPVGIDAPADLQVSEKWLRWVGLTGIDWVYLDLQQATTSNIALARRIGLRVMIYNVRAVSDLDRLAGQLPDGIITDQAEVAARFRSNQGR